MLVLDVIQITLNYFKLDRSKFELTLTKVHPLKPNFKPFWTPPKSQNFETVWPETGKTQAQIRKNWTSNPGLFTKTKTWTHQTSRTPKLWTGFESTRVDAIQNSILLNRVIKVFLRTRHPMVTSYPLLAHYNLYVFIMHVF